MSRYHKAGTRKERRQYFIDRFLSKGTLALVIALFLASAISVLVVGLILLVFVRDDLEFKSLVWISFMQTLDPGNLSFEEGTKFYILMMTISTIVGIFITSILISIISSGFIKKLNTLNQGKSKVLEKEHIIILGWSRNVPVLISELIEGYVGSGKQVIVILSRLKVSDLKDKLDLKIKNYKKTIIIFRVGGIDKEEVQR